MFMTIFFSAWTGLHLYVFWRLASIPFVAGHVSRLWLFALAVVLWAGLPLRRFLDSRGYESLAQPIEIFVMNWLGTLFLIFCALLVIDVVTVFGFAFQRYVPMLRSVGLLAGIVLAGVAFIQGLRPPVVNDYEVRLPGLPVEADGLAVAVISDLHVGRLLDGDWLAARVEQIKAMQPDMVLMLGDLFEGDTESERQESMKLSLRSLSPRYGVWAVTGNHDGHGGREAGVRFFEECGMRVLRNEWVEIVPGLVIGGIDDGGYYETHAAYSERIKQFLAAKPVDAATLYLSHRPQMIDEAASAGVDLMLSGHTHGGQIWPFSYIVKRTHPHLAGRFEIGGMSLIVSRGAGTWGPRMRLWPPGEILRITLRER